MDEWKGRKKEEQLDKRGEGTNGGKEGWKDAVREA